MIIMPVVANGGSIPLWLFYSLCVFLWVCLSGGVSSFFAVSDRHPFPDWGKGLPRKFKAICIAISPLGILFFLCVGLFFCVRWLYRELTGYGE